MARDSNGKQGMTKELIKRVAQLAKLDLSEQEKTRFGKQLAQILEYVKKVGEVDKTNRADRQELINGLVDNVRADEARQCLGQEQALKNAPSTNGSYFKVKAILE